MNGLVEFEERVEINFGLLGGMSLEKKVIIRNHDL